MLRGIASLSGSNPRARDHELQKLQDACADFESIFITHMLKSMRSAMVEEGFLGNTHESKIFKSLFDENLATVISRGGGIGVGRTLFEKLKAQKFPEMQDQNRGGGYATGTGLQDIASGNKDRDGFHQAYL